MKAQMTEEGKFFVFGEEGMGKGVKTRRGGIYNDRLTVIKNGEIVEFNVASVDPDPGYTTPKPGLYNVITGIHRNKRAAKGSDGKSYPDYLALLVFQASADESIQKKMKGGNLTWEDVRNSDRARRLPAWEANGRDGDISGWNMHAGGTETLGSEGCSVIMNGLINIRKKSEGDPDWRPDLEGDYSRVFMELFRDKERNFIYNLVGYYFLLTQ
ncbi:hypothetical protein BREVNS_0334 [Brevinematales bacterium NS]|nr:hypothetical protein BREVNS_0334 [Brevinematales bacterium NS]